MNGQLKLPKIAIKCEGRKFESVDTKFDLIRSNKSVFDLDVKLFDFFCYPIRLIDYMQPCYKFTFRIVTINNQAMRRFIFGTRSFLYFQQTCF